MSLRCLAFNLNVCGLNFTKQKLLFCNFYEQNYSIRGMLDVIVYFSVIIAHRTACICIFFIQINIL